MKMSMKHWWGDADKGKPKHSEKKKLLQWYFFSPQISHGLA